MHAVRHKHWLPVFGAVAFLILLQVAWWAALFVREVSALEQVRTENLELRAKLGESIPADGVAAVAGEAFHRRVMFLSESAFFALLTCVGLFLLYRALQVERRARDTERSFIEVVTHESKTPLTALKLRLESTLEKWGGDTGLRRELSLALQEVRRLASVFEKTLNLNRLERHALRFEVLALGDIVRDVLRRLDPLIRERGVQLALDLDDDAQVQGDLYGLQNSVQSLIENAVLYNNSADKKLAVRVEQSQGRVLLAVADNGPGIQREDEARIFQRFYRGKSGSQVSGTGLGLYLAKTIVEAHQGVLRLVNAQGGAHFEIELPGVVGA